MADGNKNLKPFQKGQSGNPKGRPKGASIGSVLKKMLTQKLPKYLLGAKGIQEYVEHELKIKLTVQEAIAIKILYLALMKDDLQAIRLITDLTEPVESIDTPVPQPPSVTFVKKNPVQDE